MANLRSKLFIIFGLLMLVIGGNHLGLEQTYAQEFPGGKEEAQKSFEEGLRLEQAGELKKAIKAYRRAIQDYPHHLESHTHLGDYYMQQKQYESAAKEYLWVDLIKPDSIQIQKKLADALLEAKLYSYALKRFRELSKKVKDKEFKKEINEKIAYIQRLVKEDPFPTWGTRKVYTDKEKEYLSSLEGMLFLHEVYWRILKAGWTYIEGSGSPSPDDIPHILLEKVALYFTEKEAVWEGLKSPSETLVKFHKDFLRHLQLSRKASRTLYFASTPPGKLKFAVTEEEKKEMEELSKSTPSPAKIAREIHRRMSKAIYSLVEVRVSLKEALK